MTQLTREQTLLEMGLGPLWKLRQLHRAPTLETRSDPAAKISVSPAPTDDWVRLREDVANCRQCSLCEQRKQAVLGVGDTSADWLFVGEGPGADEDQLGEPFVGVAGKLLDNMLAAIQLKRGHGVYIANAVKCRPPGNRTPTEDELAACRPFLLKQIELIKPRLIVALGSSAAKTLLQQPEVKVGALRGQLLAAEGVPLIVTYHPSYLLRSPMEKAKAWEDLCFMRRTMRSLQGTVSA